MMFLGELSLDGSVRSVRGALSAALAAWEFGWKALAVPEANAKEAAVVEGVDVYALKSLPQAVDLVNSPESFTPVRVDARQMLSEAAQYSVDLRDVHGQQAAKRALEVACAGGRNILFIGPPGAGEVPLGGGGVGVGSAWCFLLGGGMTLGRWGFLGAPRGGGPGPLRLFQGSFSKFSGPRLARFDIPIGVPAVKYKELRAPSSA